MAHINNKQAKDLAQQLFALQPHLFHMMKQVVFSLDLGLAPNQLQLMKILHKYSDTSPVTVNAIAKRLFVKAPSVTAAVDGLVKKGLVARKPSPTDKRVVELHLTAKGKKVIKTTHAKIVSVLSERFTTLSTQEYSTVESALGILQTTLQK